MLIMAPVAARWVQEHITITTKNLQDIRELTGSMSKILILLMAEAIPICRHRFFTIQPRGTPAATASITTRQFTVTKPF